MSELWVPGGATTDDFVRALLRQIEAWIAEHGPAEVEIELRDGSILALESVSAEPGFGFVTFTPHGDEPQAVIVPLGAVARVTIARAEPDHALGFSLPTA